MNICNFNRCFENVEEEPKPGCNCCHKPFCEKDLRCCPPACCRPCWDTCKCMDEILKLKSGLDDINTNINNIEGRLTRDENTIRDNFNNLSQIIGDLAEKEARDIAEEKERAMTAENNISTTLNNYINSNNEALAAEIARATNRENSIDDALQVEIARAKAAEQVLDSVKANKADVYTKQETYTKQEVEGRISDLINGAPAALDTLGEIADKLHDNDDVVASIINSITQEKQAREAADTNINNNISTLTTNHNADISALNSALQAEITRATNRENSIAGTIADTSNRGATLNFNQSHTIARVNGVDITVTMPAVTNAQRDGNGNVISDTYVTSLGTNGNNITWTRGGTTYPITVPYATKAQQDGNGDVISSTYLKSATAESTYAKKADAVTGLNISGTTLTVTKGNGSTSTLQLPSDQSGNVNNIQNQVNSINADLSSILSRLSALESLWTDNGSTLTAKSGRSVTGAGFYDSTI